MSGFLSDDLAVTNWGSFLDGQVERWHASLKTPQGRRTVEFYLPWQANFNGDDVPLLSVIAQLAFGEELEDAELFIYSDWMREDPGNVWGIVPQNLREPVGEQPWPTP